MIGNTNIIGKCNIFNIKYDDKKNELTVAVYEKQTEYRCLHRKIDYGVIYADNNSLLYIFGGLLDLEFTTIISDRICIYSFKTKQWILPMLTLQYPLHGFGYTLTSDKRYILIFGGRCIKGSMFSYCDDIFVIDLKCPLKPMMLKSYIKCPIKGLFHAFTVKNKKEIFYLISGFLRLYQTLLPNDIIKFIVLWYGINDIIHLFQRDGNKQWKIDVDNIIKTSREKHYR